MVVSMGRLWDSSFLSLSMHFEGDPPIAERLMLMQRSVFRSACVFLLTALVASSLPSCDDEPETGPMAIPSQTPPSTATPTPDKVCPWLSPSPTPSIPIPTPPNSSASAITPPYLNNPAPFEVLFREYDYVVRASLVSIRAETEAVPTGYRPVHRLRYSVHEWLRGSGPGEIEVVLRPDHPPGYTQENRLPWCSNEADAQTYAERLLSTRNSDHESHQVLMLLNRDSGDPIPEYRLNVRTQQVWDYHTDREVYFLATRPGPVGEETTFRTKSTSPIVSLPEFRTRLRDLDNALAASQHFEADQSVKDYEDCIHIRLNVQYFYPERIIDWTELKDKIYEPCLPQFSPKKLMVTINRTQITLTWDAPQTQSEITKYIINRHDENGWRTIIGTTITEERYIDDNVEPGGVYSYKIWAIDDWGWGPASEILTVEIPE